jgi:hypothetical protein
MCQQCPCDALIRLQKAFDDLVLQVRGGSDPVLSKKGLTYDIALDRQRLTKLEHTIGDLKDSMRQITVSKVEGSWGIVDKRADIVFSRLLAFSTNGKPYFSTLDVKNILGVRAYAQSKEAMVRCVERHPGQVLIIQRGPKKVGIALVTREVIEM